MTFVGRASNENACNAKYKSLKSQLSQRYHINSLSTSKNYSKKDQKYRKTYLWLLHKEFNMYIGVWTSVVGSTSFANFVDLEEGSCLGQSHRCPLLHEKWEICALIYDMLVSIALQEGLRC